MDILLRLALEFQIAGTAKLDKVRLESYAFPEIVLSGFGMNFTERNDCLSIRKGERRHCEDWKKGQ